MIIIGCDYHPGFQQIAYVNTDTGELQRSTPGTQGTSRAVLPRTQPARRDRAGGHGSQWACALVRASAERVAVLSCGSAMPPPSARKRVRKQKTDRQDAQLLLRLLLEDRFPRIWVPDAENRDLRQLLWHRHRTGADAHAGHEPVARGGAQ